MDEMSFCPYCSASRHKLLLCKEDTFFCKECNRFFVFEPIEIKCERCNGKLIKSDFDSPSSGAVFFCNKCKRTYPSNELFTND